MSRLVLFLGSTRDGRNGTRVATHLVTLLRERNHAVTVFGETNRTLEADSSLYNRGDLASPHSTPLSNVDTRIRLNNRDCERTRQKQRAQR